jgi:membrane associated rhomboid family serine protease
VSEIMLDAIASSLPEPFRIPVRVLGGFVAVLWILELTDTVLLRGRLNYLGIRPRQLAGLRGILLAPLLHGDLWHLFANTIPLVVLGSLILLDGVQSFWIVTVVVWLVSGVGTWLFGGSGTNHIGASGIVFGYFGFLVLRGYFVQSPTAIAIALLVGLVYGSMIWGVLPIHRGKSWQGHLFGFVGGGLAARHFPELQNWFNQLN